MPKFDWDNLDFIEEFRKLDLQMPKCGSWTRASENCDYGDIITVSKDCYMCFNSGNCRDVYYAEDCRALKDCGDCTFCEECELCYQCVDCDNCYNCDFCQDCSNCQDCRFSYDLKRCRDCFGCVGLRDKQYYIFNKKYSKEDYEKFVSEFGPDKVDFVRAKVEELKSKAPRMYTHQLDNENCVGDYIYHSKNCYMCFDTRHTEDSGNIFQANLDMGTRNSWDCGPIPTGMDLCYDVAYAHYLFNCNHVYFCGNLKECNWVTNCLESSNLFGCNYMRHKEDGFYILNEKVNEDFYRKKTAEIEVELKVRGIYTLWDLFYKDLSLPVIKVDDSEMRRNCQVCGDQFEIVEVEKEFCLRRGLALPVYCVFCRAEQRRVLRNERKAYKRHCDGCKKALVSTFPPDTQYRVVCLDCYWKDIN